MDKAVYSRASRAARTAPKVSPRLDATGRSGGLFSHPPPGETGQVVPGDDAATDAPVDLGFGLIDVRNMKPVKHENPCIKKFQRGFDP